MDAFAVFVSIGLVIGLVYVVIDFVLGMVLGRCVLPGLKCKACRK